MKITHGSIVFEDALGGRRRLTIRLGGQEREWESTCTLDNETIADNVLLASMLSHLSLAIRAGS